VLLGYNRPEDDVRDEWSCEPGESTFEDYACLLADSYAVLAFGETLTATGEGIRKCEGSRACYGILAGTWVLTAGVAVCYQGRTSAL